MKSNVVVFLLPSSVISGPIILDTYRVIADFEKTSKHEINLQTGDLVEIVEKNQNGEKSSALKRETRTKYSKQPEEM